MADKKKQGNKRPTKSNSNKTVNSNKKKGGRKEPPKTYIYGIK